MAFNILSKLKKFVSDPKISKSSFVLVAPISGEVIPITDVPDVVFSEKIIGDGVAIKPTSNLILSPCDGVVFQIFDTNHCVVIHCDNNVEILIHFGIDTVELGGKGFKRLIEVGSKVKIGEPLIELDLSYLENNAKSTITPVVVTNQDEYKVKDLNCYEGKAIAGETKIMGMELEISNGSRA